MKTLWQHWNIVRVVRLVLGLLMVAQGFSWQSPLIGISGGLLIVTALLNVGCFGRSCSISPSKKGKTKRNDF